MGTRYLHIYIIYFLAGFAGFSAVTDTFFMKEHVSLSASELIGLSMWISLPWSIKLLFGSIIDTTSKWISNRHTVLFAALLMLLGEVVNVSLASGHQYFSQYFYLLISGLLITLGSVIADIVADTESVTLARPLGDVEVSKLQVWGRTIQTVGGLLAALITGFLASNFSMLQVYQMRLLLPVGILIACLFISNIKRSSVPNYWLLGLSIVFALIIGIFHDQLITFSVQMVVINGLLLYLASRIPDSKARWAFLLSCLGIFAIRMSPDSGPGYGWWMIDVLGYTPHDLGLLRIVGGVTATLGIILLGKRLGGYSPFRGLALLSIAVFLTSLPPILVYSGGTTVNPKLILLIDQAVGAPLAGLSMIPLGILVARYAPLNGAAFYMSLTASFQNMALVGGDLISQKLNEMYIVTRGEYSKLGILLVSCLVIGTLLSILGLMLLYIVNNTKVSDNNTDKI